MSLRVVALIRQPGDLAAVQVGVGLGDTSVVSLAPDTPATEELLAQARSIGATRCIRIWDEVLTTTDFVGLAITLAAAVKKAAGDLAEPATLILCGDNGRGAVGPAVAERLGIAHLSDVIGCKLIDERVVARRRVGGVVRLYAGKPPLLLNLSAGLDPVAANHEASGWTEALTSNESWRLEEIGLNASEIGYRRRFRPQAPAKDLRGPSAQARVFTDADALVARLRADGVLDGGD